MNPSQRIVLNTGVTYARSVLAAVLALFSSRWVLAALGQTDFGLFSLVGSIIVFITFMSNVMAGSAARHYAYSIGQGDMNEVNHWFNTALSIHLVMAAVLVGTGWPLGEYVCVHYLTIPAERLPASLWVFRISLISAIVSIISIPFVAMFRAKQNIAELAVWNMLYSVLVFFWALFLNRVPGDQLVIYTIGMVCIIVIVSLGQIVSAAVFFRECRIEPRKWFDKNRAKEIFSFASWSLIGNFGQILRNQGSAILLNLYFGPRLNAAFGIANQVSHQANTLASAMFGAFSPEITTSEGRGDRERMLSLSLRASKFGTILVMLFAIPLMIEMDYVLKLWLVEPPPYAAMFCRFILATFIVDKLSSGYMAAVIAHGKIAAYQVTVGTTLIMTLPLAWVFIRLGAPPTSVGIAFVVTMTGVTTGRVLWARRLFGVPAMRWAQSVLWPSSIVCIVSIIAMLVIYSWIPLPLLRLLCVLGTGVGTTLTTTWFWALDNKEREFFQSNISRLLNRITRK